MQGKYTVTFFGTVASVPDATSSLGLLAVTLGGLAVAHQRRLRMSSAVP